MTLLRKIQRPSAKEVLPPMMIGALGSAVVIALSFLIPGFQFIELVVLLIAVAFSTAGYKQGIIRGIMTIAMIYFATAVAAALYRILAPYVAACIQVGVLLWEMTLATFRQTGSPEFDVASIGQVNHDTLAISFGLLAIIIWVVMDIIGRRYFQDTGLPRLGIVDKLGGVVVYLVIGLLVASITFNTAGYGSLRRTHNKAVFRQPFNKVLYVHYQVAQSFWFPKSPPPIYVYDLDPSRGR